MDLRAMRTLRKRDTSIRNAIRQLSSKILVALSTELTPFVFQAHAGVVLGTKIGYCAVEGASGICIGGKVSLKRAEEGSLERRNWLTAVLFKTSSPW